MFLLHLIIYYTQNSSITIIDFITNLLFIFQFIQVDKKPIIV